jgi:hypothetical protein
MVWPTEITRLQNSLKHLKSTQAELREALESPPDPDISQALEENNVVMSVSCPSCFHLFVPRPTLWLHRGSQEERIEMLKLALSHHGIDAASASHYTLSSLEASQQSVNIAGTGVGSDTWTTSHPIEEHDSPIRQGDTLDENEDEGVHL